MMVSKYIFSLNLPAEFERPVKELAKKNGVSITMLIRGLLEKEIEKEGISYE